MGGLIDGQNYYNMGNDEDITRQKDNGPTRFGPLSALVQFSFNLRIECYTLQHNQ